MKDNLILTAVILVIVASFAYMVWYGFFYWTNCAFTEAAKAPALCYQGNR